jgi:RHS repeat-associated protein
MIPEVMQKSTSIEGQCRPFPVQTPDRLPQYRFPAQANDAAGMDYMLARYYSSSLGRFMAVDPSSESIVLTDPQSWNRYTYGANNPIRYIDPDGTHNEEGHTTVTEEALACTMSEEAVAEVSAGNLAVDENQGTDANAANQHGMAGKNADGTYQTPQEAAQGATEFVDAQLAAAVDGILAGDVSGARAAFGAATHTVQDEGADSHQGARWEGMAGTAVKSPVTGIQHARNDGNLTARERHEGVANTQALHGTLTSMVQSAGQARGLSDATVAGALTAFNGR